MAWANVKPALIDSIENIQSGRIQWWCLLRSRTAAILRRRHTDETAGVRAALATSWWLVRATGLEGKWQVQVPVLAALPLKPCSTSHPGSYHGSCCHHGARSGVPLATHNHACVTLFAFPTCISHRKDVVSPTVCSCVAPRFREAVTLVNSVANDKFPLLLARIIGKVGIKV